MDRQEIVRRYELAMSDEWEQIRDLLLDKIIYFSKGAKSPEQLQGMLQLIDIPNDWIEEFYAEKKRAEKENEQ